MNLVQRHLRQLFARQGVNFSMLITSNSGFAEHSDGHLARVFCSLSSELPLLCLENFVSIYLSVADTILLVEKELPFILKG